ncbi:MAG: hypothetical protein K9H64_20435 [Bacteroidales bacterium]|nr:hypothetical protein [Bacteroidales bacterium]MCF8458425.1 hypothetical protein [Bacteroidales bacterium]
MSKKKNDHQVELQEIEKEVQRIEWSQDGILDLLNYIEKSISIAKSYDSDRTTNECLNQLIQTKEKQAELMTTKSISQMERKLYFDETKTNFLADLNMFCLDME